MERTPFSVYASFIDWRDNGGFTYNCNRQQLGIKLNTIAKGAITKGNHNLDGDTKIFDITKLKELYGIGICLIENPFDSNDNHKSDYNQETDELVENDK